jgi:hypothetical protein
MARVALLDLGDENQDSSGREDGEQRNDHPGIPAIGVRHRIEHVSLSFCGQRQILLETLPIDFRGYKSFR